ncbi:MAG: hypothetical protein AAGA93_09460 [Actinomycetota bacterium]
MTSRGWSPLDAKHGEGETINEQQNDEQKKGAKDITVIGVGAVCDLASDVADNATSTSFVVNEFLLTGQGDRIRLHNERGFTLSGVAGGDDPLPTTTFIQQVLNVVLPDDEDDEEDHPWSWLAELAEERGIVVGESELAALRYEVLLSDRVLRWLAPPGRERSSPAG